MTKKYNKIIMEKKDLIVSIPVERIENKILLIRGQKVMLDKDLAGLYGVETKRLKEQVKETLNASRRILCLN